MCEVGEASSKSPSSGIENGWQDRTTQSVVLCGEGWFQEDSVLVTEALSQHEAVELCNDGAHESLTVVPR
jgi:hypothetical protein